MSTDSTYSMPMYDGLADHIKWLLLEGATYRDAPDLGAEGRCLQRVKANAAQIVAWWCAEDAAQLATACAASAPGTRRYFDRDVMLGLYPAPQKPEEPEEENQHG